VSLSPGIIARELELSEKVLEAGQADSKNIAVIGRKTTKAP